MISINHNFLSPTEVTTLLNFAINDAPKDWNINEDYYFWKNRTLEAEVIKSLGPQYENIVNILVNARKRIKQHIVDIRGLTVPLYADTLQIVRWPEGYEQPPHADAETNDGGPHPYSWRYSASICYLNDNFDGGEIYFPQHDLSIKPSPGTMVTFPGTAEYLHGVRGVKNGVRYTTASFFTTDPTKADIWPI